MAMEVVKGLFCHHIAMGLKPLSFISTYTPRALAGAVLGPGGVLGERGTSEYEQVAGSEQSGLYFLPGISLCEHPGESLRPSPVFSKP